MKRAQLALASVGAAVMLTAGMGTSHTEARAEPSAATVYLWKDVNGKCPAACDRNTYDCPCKTAADEEIIAH